MHGLRGDDDARAAWLDIVDALATPGRPLSQIHFGEFFDALLLLHRGHPEQALHLLVAPPEQFRAWYNGMWRPWYAALWAEAAVLTRHEAAAARIDRARRVTLDNPIAAAIVDRAAALDGDRDGLIPRPPPCRPPDAATSGPEPSFSSAGRNGCGGESALAAMGATPMALLASRTRLNGVSVARRTRVNPASRSTSARRGSPACAPSPRPTSCASDAGVHTTVEKP